MERGRTGQEHVEPHILDLMSDRRTRTTVEIQVAVKKRLPPNEADSLQAVRRSNESKYDQIISNALEKGRKLTRDGLIARVSEGSFVVTDKGVAAAKQARSELARMITTADEVCRAEDWV